MSRLIDVDKFKADYGMADDCEDCKQNASLCQYDIIYSKMDFCGWLDDAPTVYAVPVVRCHDCKWMQCNMKPDGTLPKGVDEYECRHWCGACDPTDFCSRGERNDGEQHDTDIR